MIEIIKHGNRPKTDKRVKFTCGRCGCEWIADNAEYRSYIGGMGHEWVSCICPKRYLWFNGMIIGYRFALGKPCGVSFAADELDLSEILK